MTDRQTDRPRHCL